MLPDNVVVLRRFSANLHERTIEAYTAPQILEAYFFVDIVDSRDIFLRLHERRKAIDVIGKRSIVLGVRACGK
jgi:hypothetical protein